MTQRYQQRTKKRFGQHFLHDRGVIDHIIATLALSKTQRVVEIGPGSGALTFPLLEKLDHLDVIEVDRDLIQWWQQQPDFANKITLHAQDALMMDIAALRGTDSPLLRIVGNLPYNISNPLIFHLLNSAEHIQDMLFMLQKEVVERMTAQPGTKSYGRLSVMVQYHCQTEALMVVAPQAFSPPPKVDSAVVRLTPWKERPCNSYDYEQFAGLVTQAFSQRRKTLRNTLKGLVSSEQMEQLGIAPVQRAETLSVTQFVNLSNHIQRS